MSRATRRTRLVAVLGISLLLAALLEAGLRVAGFSNPPLDVPIVVWNPAEDRLLETRDYLFQADPHTLWSLRPGIRIQFAENDRIEGPPEHVNAEGWRGPLVPMLRTPGVLRIATLGDSSTFGIAVTYADTYSGQLQRLLDARGVRCEVIDAGIDGFTVRQGLERYRRLVRRYRPDVVVAAFGAVNEHWPALDMSDDAKILHGSSRAGLVGAGMHFLRQNLRLGHLASWMRSPRARDELIREVRQRRRKEAELAPTSGRPDWPGERRVSVEEFERFLEELQSEVESDGARLVLVVLARQAAAEEKLPVLPLYTAAALKVAQEEELQVLDARTRFRVRFFTGTEVAELMHDYWHPTPAGHRLIAEALVPMVLDKELNRGGDAEAQRMAAEAAK